MWEDTTRKYFFSFINENFKDWIIDEDIYSSSFIINWTWASSSKFLSILLTCLTAVNSNLTLDKVKIDRESLAIFISKKNDFTLTISF